MSSSGYLSTIFIVMYIMYLKLVSRWDAVAEGERGLGPPLHDDDELLFKSRVLLLFKIPIPKLLHARACIQRERTSLTMTICCLFVACVSLLLLLW